MVYLKKTRSKSWRTRQSACQVVTLMAPEIIEIQHCDLIWSLGATREVPSLSHSGFCPRHSLETIFLKTTSYFLVSKSTVIPQSLLKNVIPASVLKLLLGYFLFFLDRIDYWWSFCFCLSTFLLKFSSDSLIINVSQVSGLGSLLCPLCFEVPCFQTLS